MKKRNRETRDLVLAMSLGDGCITSSGYLSFIHGKNQKEYLEWKIWLLHKYGITTTNVEEFNNNGYIGYKARTYTHNFIKVFRRNKEIFQVLDNVIDYYKQKYSK